MVDLLEKEELQGNLVEEIKTRTQNYIVRNSLNWDSKLYREISKSVTMYYNSHRYEMELYHTELDDLIQNVAFTLYRWKDFNPQAYNKKLSQYIIPIIQQKCIKDKRRYFKTRKHTSISMDDTLGNSTSNEESHVSDTVADYNYRFLEFVEECLSRIPDNHRFYVEGISFNTKEIFRLLFNNYSGEEISEAAGVDGKKFRKMKRLLTKEFYSSDVRDLYNSLPSNVDFRPDYHISYSKEDVKKLELEELDRRAKYSGPLRIYSL